MRFIVKYLVERKRQTFLRRWRQLAVAYKHMGESDHWIRARITEYVNDERSDYLIILKHRQTKDEYIEDILSVLHESKVVSW